MPYRIYPAIGIARLGNDLDRFYVGPERPGHRGVEIDAAGVETAVTEYKVDADQVKRQAARFRLFELPPDGGAPQPAQLAAGSTVEWTVHLANRKAAVQRPDGPPSQPLRPQLIANASQLLVDPGSRSITGASALAVRFNTGEYKGRRVPLGELRTDKDQNLLVCGGFGFSSSPTNAPLPSFYTNPGWHDDTSDGFVKAKIRRADGSFDEDVEGAWVIVGPPDYAPEVQGVVTLYDILADVGHANFGVPAPAQISFTNHIFPMLLRTRRLQWVNSDPNWSEVSEDWAALGNNTAAAAALRSENADHVRDIEGLLQRYRLTSLQNQALDQWVLGNFASDWVGLPQVPAGLMADGLTRAALDGTIGRGFYPGIEGGILLTDPTIYRAPFDYRIDQAQLAPGDLTAHMALPWQADFFDCRGNWWPSQRPDTVRISASSPATLQWARGVTSHLDMVHNFSKLGFVTAQVDPAGNTVFVETQRSDPNLFA
ncbi:LodA/GoxA family CTQ-dependent oxidase [Mesorhizobium sp. M0036]|uniref:LodA/GoxA family CTQ-dependent oxidase n=1 Tax=Mesorhizobium sp. M0036 TaxID=2956853 RepID=UPI00333A28D3